MTAVGHSTQTSRQLIETPGLIMIRDDTEHETLADVAG